MDAVGVQYDELPAKEINAIVAEFPRLGLKDRCFTHIAKACPETTYDNSVRDFGERFVPDYHAPSAVDWVMKAAIHRVGLRDTAYVRFGWKGDIGR